MHVEKKMPLRKRYYVLFFASVFIIMSYLRSLNERVDNIEFFHVKKTINENLRSCSKVPKYLVAIKEIMVFNLDFLII